MSFGVEVKENRSMSLEILVCVCMLHWKDTILPSCEGPPSPSQGSHFTHGFLKLGEPFSHGITLYPVAEAVSKQRPGVPLPGLEGEEQLGPPMLEVAQPGPEGEGQELVRAVANGCLCLVGPQHTLSVALHPGEVALERGGGGGGGG